jgi:predicted transcriptional regulator
MPAITVRVSEEIAKQIDEVAGAMDRTRTWVVSDALKRYLETESQWIERVKAGMASIERGEGAPHEQVMEELREKIAAHQAKATE